MRGCMITIELPRIIGKRANMPDANEPMLELAAVTTATTSAAVKARSGMSKRVRTKATGPVLPRAPAQRDGHGIDHHVERDRRQWRPLKEP